MGWVGIEAVQRRRASPLKPSKPNTSAAKPRMYRRRCARHWALTRSEEHTSELQSRQYLVCRLLLEKKKIIEQPEPFTARDATECPVRRQSDVVAVGTHDLAAERHRRHKLHQRLDGVIDLLCVSHRT